MVKLEAKYKFYIYKWFLVLVFIMRTQAQKEEQRRMSYA